MNLVKSYMRWPCWSFSWVNSAHCSRCVCVCVCPLLQVCVCVCVPTAPGVCALGWVKCREHISLLVGMHRNDNSWPKPNKMKHWPILPFLSLLHKLNSQNLLITLLSCFTKNKNNNKLNTEHFYTSYQTLYQQSTISNQIKSLLLSHHHSTSALVSEILMSVLQTVQKNKNLHMDSTYLQTVQKTMCKIHIHILSTHSVL